MGKLSISKRLLFYLYNNQNCNTPNFLYCDFKGSRHSSYRCLYHPPTPPLSSNPRWGPQYVSSRVMGSRPPFNNLLLHGCISHQGQSALQQQLHQTLKLQGREPTVRMVLNFPFDLIPPNPTSPTFLSMCVCVCMRTFVHVCMHIYVSKR